MRPWKFQGNVHIINFPASTAAADLAELFDEYGLVMGAEIKTIPSDGGELRLGIVSLAPDAAADKAIEALQGHLLGGKKLKLKRAEAPPPAEKRARMPRKEPRMAESAERFPARPLAAPPRKVIVEYRGRRAKTRI